jgi:hypothetical protein
MTRKKMKKIKAQGWLISWLCGCFLAGLSCSKSPFDPSTGLGQQVVDAIYPDAVDLQHAFKAVDMGCAVSHDTSVRFDATDASDSIRSGVHTGSLTAGSLSGEYSIAYMEFRTGHLRASANLGVLQAARDSGTLDSMYLKLSYPVRSTDPTVRPATILVDTCPVKPHGIPFDTARLSGLSAWTDTVQRDSLSDTTVLIALDTGRYLPLIRRAIDTAVSSLDTDSVAFCIRLTDSSRVLRISSAQLLLRYRYLPDSVRRTEALVTSYTEYTVVEPAVPVDKSAIISSWESDRFVEIKLDLTALWDSAENAQAKRPYAVVQAAFCSLYTGASAIEPQTDSVPVLCGLLDHSLGSKLSARAMRDSLNTLFNIGRLTRAWAGRSARGFSFACTPFLQRLSEERAATKTAYLYLFAGDFPQWAQVRWEIGPAVRFNVLFTNPQK